MKTCLEIILSFLSLLIFFSFLENKDDFKKYQMKPFQESPYISQMYWKLERVSEADLVSSFVSFYERKESRRRGAREVMSALPNSLALTIFFPPRKSL